MAVNEVAIPVGGTNRALRAFEQTTTAGAVDSEAVSIVDASDPTQIVKVTSSDPAPTDPGLVVRVIGSLVLSSSVEVSNDVGNPIPVNGTVTANAGTNLNTSALGLDTTLQQVRDRSVVALSSADVELTHVPFTVTASGDTDLRTPAAGKAIRLHWISLLNDPSAASPALLKVFLGTDEKYRGYAISKRQRTTGPVDGHFIINLSASGNVSGTAILEEV